MFQKENALIDRFTTGLTRLSGNIKLKNKIRYLDDNITAEQFICQLMRILYEKDYRSDNGTDGLTAGYDLICESTSELIQVSSECTPEKVADATAKIIKSIKEEKLERNKYTVRVVFLTNDASFLKNRAAVERASRLKPADPEMEVDYFFNPSEDILDFTTFAAQVKTEFLFVSDRANRLRKFMDYCSDVFPPDWGDAVPPPTDRVSKIIGEYARNFEEPLFMHYYSDPNVTLQKMYVDPAFRDTSKRELPSRDLQGYLSRFIHAKHHARDRFLFIEGDAAIGKTSMISWLCWHYTNKTPIGLAIFDDKPIICIRLRELEFEGNLRSEAVLLRYLNASSLMELEERYAGAVFVLDGADELSMVRGLSHGSVETFFLELYQTFRKHKFIITTRPLFLDMKRFRSDAYSYKHILMEHYDSKMRRDWLVKYMACGQEIPPNTEQYIRSVSGREKTGIADTPLALYLLVQCDAKDDLLRNSWALFHRIFSTAISKGEYNINFSKSGDLQDRKQRSINYRVVQSIAYRMFRNASEERYYLTSAEIDEAVGECDLEGLSHAQIRETCVLCAYWKKTDDLGALEFYHNNIRDFFLCEYLCECLIECLLGPEPLETIASTLCSKLSHADICASTWRQVYEYLCLRLEYESTNTSMETSLYNLVQKNKDMFKYALSRISSGHELWDTQKKESVYLDAKRTFGNIFMLLRILLSFCPGRIEISSNAELIQLLSDWNSLFMIDSIAYSDHFGQKRVIDAASNTEYHNLMMFGAYLPDISFNNSTFSSCKFTHVRFNKCSFKDTQFCGTDYLGCSIHRARFLSASLGGIYLEDLYMEDSFFSRTTLRMCKARGMRLYKCWIHTESSIHNCQFSQGEFDNVNIQDITVFKTVMKLSTFTSATLQGSEFNDTTFDQIHFDGVINGVIFKNCRFKKCTFQRKDTFKRATFISCTFDGYSFNEIDLTKVVFIDCPEQTCLDE